MTQLVDDSSGGMLIDDTDECKVPISFGATLIIDGPSYMLEDDLSQ